MFICSSSLWRRCISFSQKLSDVSSRCLLFLGSHLFILLKELVWLLSFLPFTFILPASSNLPLSQTWTPFCFESCLNHLYKREMFSASCFLFLIALYLCYQSCSLNKWFYSVQFINFLTPFLQNFWQFQWASNHSVKLLFLKLAVANSISPLFLL